MPENKCLTFEDESVMLFDCLFDYLLSDGIDYRGILDAEGCDIDLNHWRKYLTCYGNFTHFINLYTGQILQAQNSDICHLAIVGANW